MRNKDIEELAISKIKDMVLFTNGLSSQINDGDKEPIFDGYIAVYKKGDSTSNYRNKDFLGRVDVQVKGVKYDGKFEEEISFQVNAEYLRMFGNDGGAIMFVVYINSENKENCIYYREFKPVESMKLYRKLKRNQKTKSLNFTKFTSTTDEIYHIFLNFLEHSRLQASFSQTELKNINYYLKEGKLESINLFNYGDYKKRDFIYASNLDAYVKLKGLEILIPLPEKISGSTTTKVMDVDISVNGLIFYESLSVTESEQFIEFKLGESIKYRHSKNVDEDSFFSFKPTGNLSILLIDVNFIIHLFDYNEIRLSNKQAPIVIPNDFLDQLNIDRFKIYFELLEKTRKLLDYLEINDDLDILSISENERLFLDFLIKGIVNNQNIIFSIDLPVGLILIKICNLNILVSIAKLDDKNNIYSISSYKHSKFNLYLLDNSGNNYRVSSFIILREVTFLTCSNLDFPFILNDLRLFNPTPDYLQRVNDVLIQMILAIDVEYNLELFSIAKSLSLWLVDNSDKNKVEYYAYLFNYFQLIKRERELTIEESDEVSKVYDIHNIDLLYYLGASILLDDEKNIKKYITMLSADQILHFESFPIYKLYLPFIEKEVSLEK